MAAVTSSRIASAVRDVQIEDLICAAAADRQQMVNGKAHWVHT